MPVYVDDPIYPLGRMMMCHMLADSVDELHAMADKIALRRSWFQDNSIPHYDVCKAKRSLALAHGAIEVDRKQLVDLMRKLRKSEQ